MLLIYENNIIKLVYVLSFYFLHLTKLAMLQYLLISHISSAREEEKPSVFLAKPGKPSSHLSQLIGIFEA